MPAKPSSPTHNIILDSFYIATFPLKLVSHFQRRNFSNQFTSQREALAGLFVLKADSFFRGRY